MCLLAGPSELVPDVLEQHRKLPVVSVENLEKCLLLLIVEFVDLVSQMSEVLEVLILNVLRKIGLFLVDFLVTLRRLRISS